MEDTFKRLAAPFPPELVSWRVGSTNAAKSKGMALAYLDARDVMNRLDEVVGPSNWQDRYPHAGAKTVCEIDIWVDGRGWVTKADGAGDTDVEKEKGSLSDSFKRAAVRWGIGRYLYDLPSPWVAIEPMGRSYKITDAEKAKLARMVATPGHSTELPMSEPADTGPSARDLAISLLNTCKDQGDLRAVWAKNAAGWKKVMSDADYLAVEKVKDSLKITLPTAADPFAQEAA